MNKDFPAITPVMLLRRIAEHKDLKTAPHITVVLRSGKAYSGVILSGDFGDARRRACLVIRAISPANEEGGDLSYLDLNEVVSVTVHNPERHTRILSLDAVVGGTSDEVISKLNLQRRLEGEQAKLGAHGLSIVLAIDGADFPDENSARCSLWTCAQAVCDKIMSDQADEQGHRAWSEIRRISFAHEGGKSLSVFRQDQEMRICVDFSCDLPLGIKADLESAVDMKL